MSANLAAFNPHAAIPPGLLTEAEELRIDIHALAVTLDKLLPNGREKSLALTSLEQVSHWAHSALRTMEK